VKRGVKRIVVSIVIIMLLITPTFSAASTGLRRGAGDVDLLQSYLEYSAAYGKDLCALGYVYFITQQGYDVVVRHRYFSRSISDDQKLGINNVGYALVAEVVAINEMPAEPKYLMSAGARVRRTEVQPIISNEVEIARQSSVYVNLAGRLILVMTGIKWPIISFVDALVGSMSFPTAVYGNVVAITLNAHVRFSHWYEVRNATGNWSPYVVTESRMTNVVFSQHVTRSVAPWDTVTAHSTHNDARREHSPRWGADVLNFQDAELRHQLGWGVQVYRWNDAGGTRVDNLIVFP